MICGNVRLWHKADMPSALHMSALGVKRTCLFARTCLLLTQSGHQPPHALIFSVASLNRYNALS